MSESKSGYEPKTFQRGVTGCHVGGPIADGDTFLRGAGRVKKLLVVVAALTLMARRESSFAEDRAPRVTVLRTPGGGIQPQATADASGWLHLISYQGDPRAGDIVYTSQQPGHSEFSTPVRVNSQAGSAVAAGTIRGAQIALGRKGRVHVAWNGSAEARPENPRGGAPMLYARSDATREAFETQRNLMQRTSALDGGGTVAADARGHVFVAWHGRPQGADEGESRRRMFAARSDDDGASFAPEEPALAEETGACACCGTRALAASDGTVYLLFRAAAGGTKRDLMLLTSHDRGGHFDANRLHPWSIAMCPMSSETLAEGGRGVVAAWETQGQVFFARIGQPARRAMAPVHPVGSGGNRKHPAVAVNQRGEILLAWTEDTSFSQGGSLAWRLFDATGRPTRENGRVPGGIPHNSLPTAVARPDGSFVLFH